MAPAEIVVVVDSGDEVSAVLTQSVAPEKSEQHPEGHVCVELSAHEEGLVEIEDPPLLPDDVPMTAGEKPVSWSSHRSCVSESGSRLRRATG